MATEFLIGIDLGGTKIAAAAFDLAGNRLGRIARLPTMAGLKSAVTLMNLKRVVKQAKLEAKLSGAPVAVGMGSSGPLDLKNQLLQDGDSLPNLVGFEIGKFCRQEFGAPLHLENDAACFTLGEAMHGAGLGREIVLGVTLGTGFGCGVTIGGRIYSGATNNAGEVAYCPVGDSDFDTAGSGNGVVEQYVRYSGSEVSESITAKQVGDLAERGDLAATKAWESFGAVVGTAIGTLCCVLDPHVVVIGGSVSHRLDLFEPALVEAARAILPPTSRDGFRVQPSQLGDAAGVTGAAEHARGAGVGSLAGGISSG